MSKTWMLAALFVLCGSFVFAQAPAATPAEQPAAADQKSVKAEKKAAKKAKKAKRAKKAKKAEEKKAEGAEQTPPAAPEQK